MSYKSKYAVIPFVDCPACLGSGKTGDNMCSECKGAGKVPGAAPYDADYFVLDLSKDGHARAALQTYADSVRDDDEELASELYRVLQYYHSLEAEDTRRLYKWLDEVADKVKEPGVRPGEWYEEYISKYDGSFLASVGLEQVLQPLADRGVTENLTDGVGFSPSLNKWFGWSDRAIAGFTIGSTCKKGDCHYMPANLEDEIEDAIRFWSTAHNTNVKAEVIEPGKIRITWKYVSSRPREDTDPMFIEECTRDYDPNNWGRGEWAAETMEDAKQMAIDFHARVSR